MQYNKYIIKTSAYPWNGEGFLMVERLSKQRLSVCLIDIHHCLTKRNKNKRWKANTTTANSWLQARCGSFHAHHVPELVEGHDKAGAHSPQSLEGPDVNFDPYPLLNASVQLPQRTAFTYWRHTTKQVTQLTVSATK